MIRTPFVALLSLLALFQTGPAPTLAPPVDYTTIPVDPAVVSQELKGLEITLAKAIETAQKEAGGLASSAKLTGEGAARAFEVEVYTPKVCSRVGVDPHTGKVLRRTDTPRFPGEPVTGNWTETPSGLKYYELKPGDGASPTGAKTPVRIHIVCYLVDGTKFESTVDRGIPLEFGLHKLMKGLEEGVRGMKVGGKRKLILPYDLAYGIGGKLPEVPPRATLIIDVELLAVL